MSDETQTAGGHSAGQGGFTRPWLWLWLTAFAVLLAASLLLELSAGESLRGIHYPTQLFQAALLASALTGLAWIGWVFCCHDESGGRPASLFMLGAALTLILLLSLFYKVENYRGKRAWLKCLQTSVARGEKLTLAELAPPAVPDDENFAMQPIWVEAVTAQIGPEKARSWYGDRVRAFGETNSATRLDLKRDLFEVLPMTNYTGSWQLAHPTDLNLWRDYYRQLAQRTNYFPVPSQPRSAAEDVLLALSRSDDTIEALRAASQRPHARLPVSYGDENPAQILLPHLAALKSCVSFLQLRAIAELQAGKAESALDDIKLMLRLNDLIRDEPFFISHLVHIAMFQIEVQAIWQGLAEHRWNDEQLCQLDARLARLDFLAAYTRAMAGEKAFGCQAISYVERNRRELRNEFGELVPLPASLGENEALMNVLARVIPVAGLIRTRRSSGNSMTNTLTTSLIWNAELTQPRKRPRWPTRRASLEAVLPTTDSRPCCSPHCRTAQKNSPSRNRHWTSPDWASPWNAIAWPTGNFPTSWKRCRQNSSRQSHMNSSMAGRCGIVAPKMPVSFCIRSDGMKPMMEVQSVRRRPGGPTRSRATGSGDTRRRRSSPVVGGSW